MKDGSFFRLFLGQVFSSFGDWVGLLAILALVKRIYDNEFAVAAVLLARLGPALFFGPVAGVLVDRYDRKKLMIACDLARAGLILILPFIESISGAIPLLSPVTLLFIISAALEMLTLLWQPAKDSVVPDMVGQPSQYSHAYSLLLLAAYATFPLAGAMFGVLAKVSEGIGNALDLIPFALDQERLALFFDAATFMISAGLTLTLNIRKRPPVEKRLDLKVVWRELTEGIRFIRRHPMIRVWVLGIGGIFAGIGVFISMSLFFVSDVLGGGPSSFGLLVTAVGGGLGAGFVFAGPVALVIPKDILFSTAVVAMGGSMVGFGAVSTLLSALVMGAVAGIFAGFSYPTGYALVQERLGRDLRGRTTAAVNTLIRLAVVGASAFSPALVKLIDGLSPGIVQILPGQAIDLRGVRVVMWLGGLTILGAGIVTTRAVAARHRMALKTPGVFIVFEGGEGSGKSTQMRLLKGFLESRGRNVVVTAEPGGTQIGERVRNILLDTENEKMSYKAEALLYAADRAQHVDEVIRPSLEEGAIVISDRYVDSSIAYQGGARGLGMEEIRSLNRWGTGGLFPDVVFLFDIEAGEGLARSGVTDRIEGQGLSFHEKVRSAYRVLAHYHSDRFVIVDGSRTPEEIAEEIRERVEPLLDRVADRAAREPAANR
ncbi:MAG: dTMP kinase [Actinomycetota bacterium]